MNNKQAIITAIFLLIGSFNLLTLGVIYYQLEGEVVNYRYSDEDEYDDIKEGIDFIQKLPIQINIENKYFSKFDYLEEKIKEEIIMAYAIKNNFHTYPCKNDKTSICIDKTTLEDNSLLEKFHTKTKISSNTIKIYIDDYGVYQITSSKSSNTYQLHLQEDNKKYRKYSKFSHFKQKEKKYIFYFYEGYYTGNCQKGEKLDLLDFMTGKVIYSNYCNGNNEFMKIEDNSLDDLQMYKYELEKDENNKFYLSGYNPVYK